MNLPCPLCLQKHSQLIDVELHLRTVHQLQPITLPPATGGLKCKHCDRSFSSSKYWDVHARSHSQQFVYECSLCDQMFLTTKFLCRHVQLVHAAEFSDARIVGLVTEAVDLYATEHLKMARLAKRDGGSCRPNILWLVSLVAHANRRNLSARFRCGCCDLVFVKQLSLELHYERNHPAETWEPGVMLSCTFCPLTEEFECAQKLVEHLCVVHGAEYANGLQSIAEGADNNSDDHTKAGNVKVERKPLIRMYDCDKCEKSYNHPSSLKTHSLTHIGIKAFKCELCKKSFMVNLI